MDFDEFLTAWSALLEERLNQAHLHVAERISQQILPPGLLTPQPTSLSPNIAAGEKQPLIPQQTLIPQGRWGFPQQALLKVQAPLWKEIEPAPTQGDALRSTPPFIRKRRRAIGEEDEPWVPSGFGWVRPMQMHSVPGAPVSTDSQCRWTLVHTPQPPPTPEEGEPSLYSSRGLLVFVAADEETVAAVAAGRWQAHVDGRTVAVEAERYEGYCDFEKMLRFAVQVSPALEAWLPPCYPYSRKILHLRFKWPKTPGVPPLGMSELALSLDVSGEIGRALKQRLQRGDEWLTPNPIPVVQIQMDWQKTDRDITMGPIEVPFDKLQGVLAAVGVHGLERETVAFVQDGTQTRVDGGTKASVVWIYHGSQGDIEPDQFTSPDPQEQARRRELTDSAKNVYTIQFPPVGGMTANFADPKAREFDRYWWHRLFLRSHVLSFGDLQEILQHLPDCRRYFDLSRMGFCLDSVDERLEVPTRWDNYLWPSRIADPFLSQNSLFARPSPAGGSETPQAGQTASLPISPVARLTLPVKQGVHLPAFLLQDIADHAASYLAQNFAIGWYRIVSEVTP